MIRTHFHYKAFHTEHEARLCRREGAERAHEAAAAYQEMHNNKDIVVARAQFDNPDLRREYPEMTGKRPLDRSFFMALMLGSALPADPSRKGYATIERKDMRIADPFRLARRGNKEVGEWLSKNVQPSVLLQLDKTPKPTTEPELSVWHERIGLVYKHHMERGKLEWERTGNFNDTLLSRVPLERYRAIRTQIDDIFAKNNIIVPGIDADKTQLGDKNISRREYLALLSLVWNEKDGENILELLTAEAAQGVERVRTFIKTRQPAPSEADKAYIDLSLEELGPSETLAGLGITIPVDLRRNYYKALSAKNTDGPEYIETEAGPVLTGRPKMLLKPEDSAAVWDTYPERAYTFLSTYMAVPGTGNIKFLDAMRYYFVISPSEQLKTEPKPVMTEKDTRAMLHIISQMLTDSERVNDNTNKQKVGFLEQLTLADKVENGAGDIFRYMLDIKNHPIGSSAMWLLAAGVAYQTYKFVTGKHKRGTTWLAYGAVAGVAVGLYQQSRNGEAWWETVWNKANTLMGRERTKEPAEQTLPNYWAEELKMDSDKERVMLAMLGEGKVGDVMKWYGAMRTWKKGGSKMEEGQPELELNSDPRYDKFFGNATWDQRNEMLYTVMSKFLANRGRAVKSAYPGYLNDMKLEDDEAMGNAYINDRYLDQSYVVSVISGIKKMEDVVIEIDGNMVTNWNDNDPRMIKIKTEHPKIYASLFRIHLIYEQERQIRASQNWDMSTIFLLEANPETLRRMGRAGNEAASLLDVISRRTQDTLREPFKDAPEDRAAKEELLGGAEEMLLGKLGERFLQKNDPDAAKTNEELRADFDEFMKPIELPPGMKEKIIAVVDAFPGTGSILETIERARFEVLVLEEWFEYLDRLPVDSAGKDTLAKFLPAFLAKNEKIPQVEMLNAIERIKYQLLILAVKKDSLLDASVLDKLDSKNSATWSVLFDRTVDAVWFSQTAFPKMESLSGLQSLFNSEASEQGGVEWYNLFRLFPRWKQTNFTVLRNQVTTYQNALARLRVLPIVAPGSAPLDASQIDALEIQLARRMANRTLEALLLTHGRGVTPDLAGERTVSPIEQGNLLTYNDEIFRQILGGKGPEEIQPNVVLPSTLENINNYVWNKLPGDVMAVTDKTTGAVKYYVWDPTYKFWAETGIPWIKENLDKLNIAIGEGIILAEKEIQEFIAYISPILEDYKNQGIKLYKDGTKYVLELGTAGVKLASETIDGLRVQVERLVASLNGLPTDKLSDYIAKVDKIKSIPGMYVQVRNKTVEVAVAPDSWSNRGLAMTNPALLGTLLAGNLGAYRFLGTRAGRFALGGTVVSSFRMPVDVNTLAFMTPMTPLNLHRPLQFTIDNFLSDTRTPEQLASEWLAKAIVPRQAPLRTKIVSGGGIEIRVKPGATGLTDIEISTDAGFTNGDKRAEMPPHIFFALSDDQIAARYQAWMKKTPVEKAANRYM